MATKPTRMQQQACDQLAEALVLITEAARLDGRGGLDAATLGAIVKFVGQASSAFEPAEIVTRALGRRGAKLGVPASAIELLTLMDSGLTPLEMLMLADDAFRDQIQQMEDELGDV